jgi:hypothetical protein
MKTASASSFLVRNKPDPRFPGQRLVRSFHSITTKRSIVLLHSCWSAQPGNQLVWMPSSAYRTPLVIAPVLCNKTSIRPSCKQQFMALFRHDNTRAIDCLTHMIHLTASVAPAPSDQEFAFQAHPQGMSLHPIAPIRSSLFKFTFWFGVHILALDSTPSLQSNPLQEIDCRTPVLLECPIKQSI